MFCCFFFQAEDGIRDLVRSRGLGDVYKRQPPATDHGGTMKVPGTFTASIVTVAELNGLGHVVTLSLIHI